MADIRRFVIGPNQDGLSAVLADTLTNVQEVPDIFWRATLWGTTESPADNTIDGDRAQQVSTREPDGAGLISARSRSRPTSKIRTSTAKSWPSSTRMSSRSTRRPRSTSSGIQHAPDRHP
jgi:hypothetical protein